MVRNRNLRVGYGLPLSLFWFNNIKPVQNLIYAIKKDEIAGIEIIIAE